MILEAARQPSLRLFFYYDMLIFSRCLGNHQD
jgi:hypothetical protein